mgnify:CR=1 FL=1
MALALPGGHNQENALAATAVALAAGIDLPVTGDEAAALVSYGAIILSFMAGTHWGLYLSASERSAANLFITSNVVTLAAWAAFLAGPAILTLAVLGAGFVFLLYIDYGLRAREVLTPDYLRTRLHATVIVVAALIVTISAL